MFPNGKTVMRKKRERGGGREEEGGVFVGKGGVVIQRGCIVNSCHYIRTSLALSSDLYGGGKALNKQPVELSQLEPFSIITSSTILHLHCIYLA